MILKCDIYCEECGNADFTEITRYTTPKPPYYWKPELEKIYRCNKCGTCYKMAGGDFWRVECKND